MSRLSVFGRHFIYPSTRITISKRPNINLFTDGLKVRSSTLAVTNNQICSKQSSCDSGGKYTITYTPYVKEPELPHDYKNMKLNRPMSPHLTIYGPTVPAMTSIGLRATGIGLTLFAALFSGASLMLPQGLDSLLYFIQSLGLPEGLVIGGKTAIAFTYWFHVFIAIRFIMFWMAKWMTLKLIYSTAYAGIVLAACAAVASALIGHAI